MNSLDKVALRHEVHVQRHLSHRAWAQTMKTVAGAMAKAWARGVLVQLGGFDTQRVAGGRHGPIPG